jgi:tetratricopeptide (TPR) repeat protein
MIYSAKDRTRHPLHGGSPMTATLNLFDHLLARARRHHLAGQRRPALDLLRKLTSFPDLPVALAAEAHALTGEILLRRRHYRRARRHLRQAARLRPAVARHHFLLGFAWHHDPEGDLARAERHYRRSLALQPRQPRCLGELGQLVLACGRADEGVALLGRAAEIAPADAAVVRRLADGLTQAGRPDEALEAARSGLFQAPRCPRMRQVWIDLQLARVRRRQQTAAAAADTTAVILPFVRLVREMAEGRRPVREEDARPLAGPHFVRLRPREVRRRAP